MYLDPVKQKRICTSPVLASRLWESTFVHLQPLHPYQCRVHIYLPMHKGLGQFQPLHPHQCRVHIYLPVRKGLGQFQPLHPHQCRVHIYLPMKALDTCYIYTLISEHQDVVHFLLLQYAGEGSVYLFRGERERDVSIYLGVNGRGTCPSI